MKKRNEWVRRALKREEKEKEKDRGIVGLIRIMFHYFKELSQWINSMKDPGTYLISLIHRRIWCSWGF